MAEYIAGRGTTALGIIGTSLGGLAVAGQGLLNSVRAPAAFENTCACMHDVETVEKLAAKDAEIARLNSERYSDAALATAQQFARESALEVYKELKKDISDMKEVSYAKWAEQGVINANVNSGLNVLSSQVQSVTATLASITKTAIPSSAICDFGKSGCNSCAGNI